MTLLAEVALTLPAQPGAATVVAEAVVAEAVATDVVSADTDVSDGDAPPVDAADGETVLATAAADDAADEEAEAEADVPEEVTAEVAVEPLLTWEEGGRVWLSVPGDLVVGVVLARLKRTEVPGGVLWLSLGARPTTAAEVGQLCEQVGAQVGRPVAGVRCMRGALSEGVRRAVGVAVEWEGDAPSETEGRGRQVLVVERTLRSGAAVRFRGDVLVYGDVNAGAEIEAGGNIIVLGALRGLAWAGNGGDETATIISFDLRPVQLRIGKQIAFLPERGRLRGARGPESAVVREGQIVLQEYRGRLSG